MSSDTSNAFFERVVAATKLTPLLAPFVVQRICVANGVFASELTAEELRRILPQLIEAVTRHLDPAKVPAMTAELTQLAGGSLASGGANASQ